MARRSAVKARTQAFNQLHGLLVEADDALRQQLVPRRKAHFARACAAIAPTDGFHLALASLGRRWLALHQEATDLEHQVTALVKLHAPKLVARHGVGALSAAQLLVTAGANPQRLRSDAALAALCGASPVEASSGKTVRHRPGPRRRPRRQHRPVDDRPRPPGPRPAHPRLRRPPHRPGQQPQGDPAAAQALYRP